MTYPGGKGSAGVYQTIINQIPPHHTYIEAFLGGGAILRRKRPAIINIGIEIDCKVLIDFWSPATLPFENLEIIWNNAIEAISPGGAVWKYVNLKTTLVYCDPPYLLSTRKSQYPLYRFEMNEKNHATFLLSVTNLDCMVAISGYPSSLYDHYLSDWRQIDFEAQTRGGSTAKEILWMNYPEPLKLHDYSYLGSNFRERQRIKRKAKRWVNKLMNLPTLERHAIFHVLDEEIKRCAHRKLNV